MFEIPLELSMNRDFQKKRYLPPFFPRLFKLFVSLTLSSFCGNPKSWMMAPQILEQYVPYGLCLMDNNVNVSPAFRNMIPSKPSKVPRSSQSIQQLERSGDDANGRKMFDQALVPPQKTARGGYFQESSKYVYPRKNLQVYPRICSSPEEDLKIGAELRLMRPQLQRQICGNVQDRVTIGQRKILYPLRQHDRQRVIPKAPEDNQVRTERSHEVDQNEYRRYYLRVESAGRKVLDDERHLNLSNWNVSRPVIRSSFRIPYNLQTPSQNYQPMVSQIVCPAKSRVTGPLSSLDPQDQRNCMDFTEQGKFVLKRNLGQPKSYCLTSIANEKMENAPSRPTPKDLRPHRGQLYVRSSAVLQKCMEKYLDQWATQPTFVEEVAKIAQALKEKAFLSRVSSHPVIFNNGTSSRGEPQFQDPVNSAGACLRSWPELDRPESSSPPLVQYTPQYSPISPY